MTPNFEEIFLKNGIPMNLMEMNTIIGGTTTNQKLLKSAKEFWNAAIDEAANEIEELINNGLAPTIDKDSILKLKK
jgi:hypothetical protein